MLAAESAGFKPATNWAGATSNTGTLSALVAADGSTTSASVTWNSPGGTYANVFTNLSTDPLISDAHMMNGFLEAKDTGSVTVSATLPSSMSGGYDVYVYCYGYVDATTRTYQYTIGSTTQIVSQTGHSAAFFPGHSLASATAAVDGGVSTGTYILFSNLTGTSFTLTATPASSTAVPPVLRVPVNGIQIVYPSGS